MEPDADIRCGRERGLTEFYDKLILRNVTYVARCQPETVLATNQQNQAHQRPRSTGLPGSEKSVSTQGTRRSTKSCRCDAPHGVGRDTHPLLPLCYAVASWQHFFVVWWSMNRLTDEAGSTDAQWRELGDCITVFQSC